jgi:hypothetical protein
LTPYVDRGIVTSHRGTNPKQEDDMNYTVELENGTIGKVEGEIIHIGDEVTVSLNDENGMPIDDAGIVVEILEENTY